VEERCKTEQQHLEVKQQPRQFRNWMALHDPLPQYLAVASVLQREGSGS
jgi:hypothetical protein